MNICPNPRSKSNCCCYSNRRNRRFSRVLLKSKTLENKEPTERRLLGAAYELLLRWEEQVNKQIENLLTSCSYHCIAIEKFRRTDQTSTGNQFLLQDLYPFVPPVDEIEIMRSDHTTGSKLSVLSPNSCLLTVWLLKPCRLTVPVGSSIQFCPPVGLTQAKIKIYRSRTNPWEYPGCLGSNFPDEWPRWFTRKNLWTAKKFGKLSMNLIMATVSILLLFC